MEGYGKMGQEDSLVEAGMQLVARNEWNRITDDALRLSPTVQETSTVGSSQIGITLTWRNWSG